MNPPEKDKVKFYYIKANDFRVIHMDGVFGGLTPTGDIFMSIFSQRPPIPVVTVQPIKETGELGEELLAERSVKDGLVREIEAGIAVRPEVAETLIRWLQERVDQYKTLKSQGASVEQEKKHA
jgi:hypothetical protein